MSYIYLCFLMCSVSVLISNCDIELKYPCLLKTTNKLDYFYFNLTELIRTTETGFSCTSSLLGTASCSLRCTLSGNLPAEVNQEVAHNETVYENNSLILRFIGNSAPSSTTITDDSVTLVVECSDKVAKPAVSSNSSGVFVHIKNKIGCPIYRSPIEDVCIFQAFPFPKRFPLTNFKYDLRSLKDHTPFITNESSNSQYEVNICGDIYKKSGTTSFQVGDITAASQSSNKLVIQYEQVNKQQGMDISFECSEESEELKSVNKHGSLKFLTDKVCPSDAMNCFLPLPDSTTFFDLSVLRKPSDNWIIQTNDLVVLNFCGPLVENSDTLFCAGNASLCKETKNGIINYTLSSLKVNGKYSIEGEFKGFKGEKSIKLRLACGESLGVPKLLDGVIEWVTSAACFISVGEDCSVYHLSLYKLEPLMGKNFTLVHDDSLFSFNFCHLNSTPCNGNEQTAVCLTKNGTSTVLGYSHANPVFQNGFVRFLYQGEACYPRGPRSKVTVTLICDHLATFLPFYELQLDHYEVATCKYEFSLFTNLVCEHAGAIGSCTVPKGDSIIDLSPLSYHRGNYYVDVPEQNSRFFLNICRSLNPDFMMLCRSLEDPAICLYNETDFTSDPGPKRAFFQNPSLQERENGSVIMTYTASGDNECQDDSSKPAAEIEFQCDNKTDKPDLSLQSSSQCFYRFLMKTKYACPRKINNSVSAFTHQFFAEDSVSRFFMDQFYLLPPKSVETQCNLTRPQTRVQLSLFEPLKDCGENCGVCLSAKKKETGKQDKEVKKCGGKLSNKIRYRSGKNFLLFENGSKVENSPRYVRYTTTIIFECGTGIKVLEFVQGSFIIISYSSDVFCAKATPVKNTEFLTSTREVELSSETLSPAEDKNFPLTSTLKPPQAVAINKDNPLNPKNHKEPVSKLPKDCAYKKTGWQSLNVTQKGVLNFKVPNLTNCGQVQFCSEMYDSPVSFMRCSFENNAGLYINNYQSNTKCSTGALFQVQILAHCLHSIENELNNLLPQSMVKGDGCFFNVTLPCDNHDTGSSISWIIYIFAVGTIFIIGAGGFFLWKRRARLQYHWGDNNSSENVLYQTNSVDIRTYNSSIDLNSIDDDQDLLRRRKNS